VRPQNGFLKPNFTINFGINASHTPCTVITKFSEILENFVLGHALKFREIRSRGSRVGDSSTPNITRPSGIAYALQWVAPARRETSKIPPLTDLNTTA